MVFVIGPTNWARLASEPGRRDVHPNTLARGLMRLGTAAGSAMQQWAGFARKCLCSPWAPEPDAKSGSHLGPGSRLGSVPG